MPTPRANKKTQAAQINNTGINDDVLDSLFPAEPGSHIQSAYSKWIVGWSNIRVLDEPLPRWQAYPFDIFDVHTMAAMRGVIKENYRRVAATCLGLGLNDEKTKLIREAAQHIWAMAGLAPVQDSVLVLERIPTKGAQKDKNESGRWALLPKSLTQDHIKALVNAGGALQKLMPQVVLFRLIDPTLGDTVIGVRDLWASEDRMYAAANERMEKEFLTTLLAEKEEISFRGRWDSPIQPKRKDHIFAIEHASMRRIPELATMREVTVQFKDGDHMVTRVVPLSMPPTCAICSTRLHPKEQCPFNRPPDEYWQKIQAKRPLGGFDLRGEGRIKKEKPQPDVK